MAENSATQKSFIAFVTISLAEINKFPCEIYLQIQDCLSKSFEFRLSIVVIESGVIKKCDIHSNLTRHRFLSPCLYYTVEKGRKLWYNKVSKFRR